MRRLGLALLASMALIGSAAAADMPAKMVTKAPIVDPPFSWTGFYVGGNAGYSWGRQCNSLTDPTGAILFGNSNCDRLNGFIGGGQLGYNWQYNQWVLGLEGDLQWSGQKRDGTFFIPSTAILLVVPATNAIYTDKLEWFGTVRGRIGWANGRWLPFITGGWAFGHGNVSGSSTGGIVSTSSASQNYSGWTVGGGLEWAFANRWSAKAEYLYIDFGNGPTVAITPAVNFVSGKMTDNILRLGVNYHF
jgi:outer membrane immunogenic protein